MKDIAFSVYRREISLNQIAQSESNFSKIVNRFFKSYIWIPAHQNFANSDVIVGLNRESSFRFNGFELSYIEWLNRVCINFIKSECKFIFLLDPSAYFDDTDDLLLSKVAECLQNTADAVSLIPDLTTPKAVDGSFLMETQSLSRSAFMLNRTGAQKILTAFDRNLCGSFADLVQIANLQILSLSPDNPERPYLYLDILSAQEILEYQGNSQVEIVKDSNHIHNLKIQAYISHWYSTWLNVDRIEKSCIDAGYNTKVLNTTKINRPTWINSLPISFFRQVEWAVRDFDDSSDFLFFVTADVTSDEFDQFFASASKVLALPNVGTFSPTLTNNHYYSLGQGRELFLDQSQPIAVINANDILMIYIHRSIVVALREYFDFYNVHSSHDPVVGPGLEELIISFCVALDRYQLLDRRYAFMHPDSKSYMKEVGQKDWVEIRRIAEQYFTYSGYPSFSPGVTIQKFDHASDLLKQVKAFTS